MYNRFYKYLRGENILYLSGSKAGLVLKHSGIPFWF